MGYRVDRQFPSEPYGGMSAPDLDPVTIMMLTSWQSLADSYQKLISAGVEVAEHQAKFDNALVQIRRFQRDVWRLEGGIDPKATDEEVEADGPFQVRFASWRDS